MASLLIPGTGGTTLLKNGVNLGHPAVLNLRLWLFKTAGIDIQKTVLDMSMEHLSDQLAPTKTTLCPDASVGPGAALTAAYNLILDKVDQTFCYDWRDCIEHSATKLLAFLETSQAVNAGVSSPHSRGGLVLIAASKLNARRNAARPFSGMAALDGGIDLPDEPSWSVDVTAGFLFQLALGSTRVRKLDDGGYLHENLPSWYFHLAGFGCKQRVGHDVGVVYRLRNDTLTRVGGAVFGQFWGPTKLWEHGDYYVGPSLHVELVHNLLLRGVLLLHGPEDGPTFTATATYAGALWDDFRKH